MRKDLERRMTRQMQQQPNVGRLWHQMAQGYRQRQNANSVNNNRGPRTLLEAIENRTTIHADYCCVPDGSGKCCEEQDYNPRDNSSDNDAGNNHDDVSVPSTPDRGHTTFSEMDEASQYSNHSSGSNSSSGLSQFKIGLAERDDGGFAPTSHRSPNRATPPIYYNNSAHTEADHLTEEFQNLTVHDGDEDMKPSSGRVSLEASFLDRPYHGDDDDDTHGNGSDRSPGDNVMKKCISPQTKSAKKEAAAHTPLALWDGGSEDNLAGIEIVTTPATAMSPPNDYKLKNYVEQECQSPVRENDDEEKEETDDDEDDTSSSSEGTTVRFKLQAFEDYDNVTSPTAPNGTPGNVGDNIASPQLIAHDDDDEEEDNWLKVLATTTPARRRSKGSQQQEAILLTDTPSPPPQKARRPPVTFAIDDSSSNASSDEVRKQPAKKKIPTKQDDIDSDSQYSWLVPDSDGEVEDDFSSTNRRSDASEAIETSDIDSGPGDTEPDDVISIGSEDTDNDDEASDVPRGRRRKLQLRRKKKPNRRTMMTPAAFRRQRDALTEKAFDEFNRRAFHGKLANVPVEWTNTLQTTAGRTRLMKRSQKNQDTIYSATIELSTKVLDRQDRLRSTLLHEMCHAAAWIIDHNSKPPHGKVFRKWASHASSRILDVTVTTTHNYEIRYKYAWICSDNRCNTVYQRQSKSIDPKKQVCGSCKGTLTPVDPMTLKPKTVSKPLSGYNLFVKQQSKAIRAKLLESGGGEKVTQSHVMKECARLWRLKKEG